MYKIIANQGMTPSFPIIIFYRLSDDHAKNLNLIADESIQSKSDLLACLVYQSLKYAFLCNCRSNLLVLFILGM